MKHLFGQICEPSMADRGVTQWIASQVVSLASPLASQERNLPTKTQGTYGQISGVLSVKSDQKCASSRMSQTCYDWDLKKSQMTCEQWAMQLRQVCLQRKKSVQRIRESDCLSWPTPIASDATVGEIIGKEDTYRQTSTGTLRKINRNGKDGSLGLARTAKMWRTPIGSDAQGGLMSEKSLAKGMMKLRDHSVQATKNWAIPARWATVIARDAKHENAASNYPTNSKLGLQAPRSTINGDLSQLTLNPVFCEWLMGLPIGWTECEPVGTAWCRWWQLMRSQYSELVSILQRLEIEND